jgi:hypothetical protein
MYEIVNKGLNNLNGVFSGVTRHNIMHLSVRMGYGLENQGIQIQFLAESSDFSLTNGVQIGPQAHPTSYKISIGCFP